MIQLNFRESFINAANMGKYEQVWDITYGIFELKKTAKKVSQSVMVYRAHCETQNNQFRKEIRMPYFLVFFDKQKHLWRNKHG